jgi:hypothetical protein
VSPPATLIDHAACLKQVREVGDDLFLDQVSADDDPLDGQALLIAK